MITIKLAGAGPLVASLDAAADDLADMTAVNLQIATRLRADALPRVPVRTGRLVGSLTTVADPVSAAVTSAVPYANPVHSGVPSRGIPASPFLATSLEANTAGIVDLYTTTAQDILDGVHGE